MITIPPQPVVVAVDTPRFCAIDLRTPSRTFMMGTISSTVMMDATFISYYDTPILSHRW